MFGFGSLSHIIVIFILALVLIGPQQLPEVARSLGRMLSELRRASNMFTSQLNSQFEEKNEKPPAMSSPSNQRVVQKEIHKEDQKEVQNVIQNAVQNDAYLADPKISLQPDTEASTQPHVSTSTDEKKS